MATTLTMFLVRLTREPELLEAFRVDPVETMNRAEVSEREQAVLLSRDEDRIRAAVDLDEAEGVELDFHAFASFAL